MNDDKQTPSEYPDKAISKWHSNANTMRRSRPPSAAHCRAPSDTYLSARRRSAKLPRATRVTFASWRRVLSLVFPFFPLAFRSQAGVQYQPSLQMHRVPARIHPRDKARRGNVFCLRVLAPKKKQRRSALRKWFLFKVCGTKNLTIR